MAQDNGCSLSPFERNQYFYSKLLTVRDFELEQHYGVNKNRLINRLILGEGIVCGLEIQIDEQNQEKDTLIVTLTPGVALDRCGCEIVVSTSTSEPLEFKSPGTKYLYIEYDERHKEPIADLGNGSTDDPNHRYNRVEETYRLSLSPTPPPARDPVPDLSGDSLDELVQQYASQLLKACSRNQHAKVPLAVVDISDTGEATLNPEETRQYRPIVRSNPMLYDLLSHVYDLAQEGVTTSKITADSFVSSDGSIEIAQTEDQQTFDFTLPSGLSGPTPPTRVFTGTRVLALATDEDLPQGCLQPVSVRIDGLTEKEPFSVILAPQLPATVPPVFRPPLGEQDGRSGLRFVFGSHPQLPRAYVAYVPQPYNKTFEIHGCDANLVELNLKQVEVVYWVIAGAKEASLRERVLALLTANPQGMMIGVMSRELDVERSNLKIELTQLVDEAVIQLSNNRYHLL